MATVDIQKKGTGFILTYGDIELALDTVSQNASTLLSHSHADHIGNIRAARHIIATSGTFDTLAARGTNINCERTIVNFGDIFGQIGVNITALNAGHVLGSTMFLMEFDDGLRVLYTGDFNTVDSIVHSAAESIDADVLITEATYGTPEWTFPNRTSVHERILENVKRTIENGRIAVCRAYSLGKAQDIALFQKCEFPVISGNKSISSVSTVYNNHGLNLDYQNLGTINIDDTMNEGCVIVTSNPKHTFNFIRQRSKINDFEKRCDIFNLSGWTLSQMGGNGFPLSAHTDFPGLLKFVAEVDPRIAYCFTRNGRILSEHLNKAGIQATS